MLIYEYTLPAYWASAIINGDESGMDDDDIAELNKFYDYLNWSMDGCEYTICLKDIEQEPYFVKENSFNSMGGDVLDYVVLQLEGIK